MEFNIKLRNGLVLSGMIESPGENTKGVIILVHGIGEHTGRYEHWAGLFRKEGFGVTGVDLPGHGRSEGRRGHISSFAVLHEMLDILVNSSRKTFPGTPLYLYGHSLGGTIVTDYLLRKNPRVDGAVVTSPWYRLAFEPPKSKVLLAALARHIVPGLVQPSGLNTDHLSHNKDVAVRYSKDPLVHDKVSVALFSGAMNAAAYALAHARELKRPMLLIHGSGDMITSPSASAKFAEDNAMVTFRLWDGGYHELHNEDFSDQVFAYILNWITGGDAYRRKNI